MAKVIYNSTTDKVDIKTSAFTSSMTIAGWARRSNANLNYGDILQNTSIGGGGYSAYYLRLAHYVYGGGVDFRIQTTSGTLNSILYALGDNNWHYWVGTYNRYDSENLRLRLYKDGNLVETGVGVNEDIITQDGAVVIGKVWLPDTGYNIDIYDVSLWNRMLTPDEISSSYASYSESILNFETGDRRGFINITTNMILYGDSPIANMIDGDKTSGYMGWNPQDATNKYIKFDLGSGYSKRITEAYFYQSKEPGVTQGVWKWQGSNNNSDWTDIGDSFTLGGVTKQTQTSLNDNVTAYRYYRILGLSGTTSYSVDEVEHTTEYEFKIESPEYNGLICQYKCDENNATQRVLDSSGNNFNGRSTVPTNQLHIADGPGGRPAFRGSLTNYTTLIYVNNKVLITP
jgi:hypothetical protein